MGKVHEAHDAEDEGKACGEEGVETAEKDALDKDVKPDHRTPRGWGRLSN